MKPSLALLLTTMLLAGCTVPEGVSVDVITNEAGNTTVSITNKNTTLSANLTQSVAYGFTLIEGEISNETAPAWVLENLSDANLSSGGEWTTTYIENGTEYFCWWHLDDDGSDNTTLVEFECHDNSHDSTSSGENHTVDHHEWNHSAWWCDYFDENGTLVLTINRENLTNATDLPTGGEWECEHEDEDEGEDHSEDGLHDEDDIDDDHTDEDADADDHGSDDDEDDDHSTDDDEDDDTV